MFSMAALPVVKISIEQKFGKSSGAIAAP